MDPRYAASQFNMDARPAVFGVWDRSEGRWAEANAGASIEDLLPRRSREDAEVVAERMNGAERAEQ